jgi:hypothetical protein
MFHVKPNSYLLARLGMAIAMPATAYYRSITWLVAGQFGARGQRRANPVFCQASRTIFSLGAMLCCVDKQALLVSHAALSYADAVGATCKAIIFNSAH